MTQEIQDIITRCGFTVHKELTNGDIILKYSNRVVDFGKEYFIQQSPKFITEQSLIKLLVRSIVVASYREGLQMGRKSWANELKRLLEYGE